MVAQTFNPSTWETGASSSLSLSPDLVYRVSSRKARTTQRNLDPQKKEKNPKEGRKGKGKGNGRERKRRGEEKRGEERREKGRKEGGREEGREGGRKEGEKNYSSIYPQW